MCPFMYLSFMSLMTTLNYGNLSANLKAYITHFPQSIAINLICAALISKQTKFIMQKEIAKKKND